MSTAVVWLNHGEAKIFELMPEGKTKVQNLESKHRGHSISHDTHKQHDMEVFFHDLATKLENFQELLLIGPGTAKKEFQHQLEKRHQKIAKAIVGVESVDHPTEPQILAFAHKFFKTYNLYNGT